MGGRLGWNISGIGWKILCFVCVERCGIGVALVVNCFMTLCDKVVADTWNNNAKFSGIWGCIMVVDMWNNKEKFQG